MRFEGHVSEDIEKRTVEEWIIHAINLDNDSMFELLGNWERGHYQHHQYDWGKRAIRAVHIVISGVVLAIEFGKEMDR